MRRAIWFSAVFWVMVIALARGGPAAEGQNGWLSGTGSYEVHFAIRLAQPMPAGAAIVCRAHLAPHVGTTAQAWATPTASGVATVDGSTARCTVEIPFRWQGAGAGQSIPAALSYEIDVVSGGDGATIPARRQGEFGVAIPALNGKESLQISVPF